MLLAVRRAALGLTTAVAVAAGTVPAPATAAGTAAQTGAQTAQTGIQTGARADARVGARPTARAAAAADWLAGELRNGLMTTEFQGQTFTDFGLSLDVYLALRDLGVKPHKRQRILDAIEPRTREYIGSGATHFAGAMGKLLTAVQLEHIDPATYAGGTLVAQLERRIHTADDSEKGRAEDSGSRRDFSNTVGQSFVVRALAMAGSGRADEATRFLLKQQCSQGFFRVTMESADHTCDGGTRAESRPSVDATALAVQALLVADRRDVHVRKRRIHQALAAAETWLVSKQRDNGAFRAAGVANSNSTGLAAAALADLGRRARADRAAEWLRQLQVTRGMAQDGALGGERGAVAFDKQAFDAAVENGIGSAQRDQWRRATTQAAAGLNALRRG